MLQHPTPREPDYLKVVKPVSQAHSRYPGPYNHSTGRFIIPAQPTPVQSRNVIVQNYLTNEQTEGPIGGDKATEYTEAETNYSISTEETGTIVYLEEEGQTVVEEESDSDEFVLDVHGQEF